ncbi:CRISPR-associated protein Cas5, partial [Clostridioides difficile]|nr:CRISPR-associated protein Cas5 [Clostridioides difficile]
MKVLQCKLKQPTAHYRDPKVFQNEYISTLNLPSKTTIMGMITYLCDRRLKSDID